MKPEIIDETNLIDALRQAFPELEQAYQDFLNLWSLDTPPGNYVLIDRTLVPRLEEELKKGQINDFLMRCALFLERVCVCGNDEAINVIWIRIFERLIYSKRDLELLWPILGPETKRTIRDAAHRWSLAARMFGHENDLPEGTSLTRRVARRSFSLKMKTWPRTTVEKSLLRSKYPELGF